MGKYLYEIEVKFRGDYTIELLSTGIFSLTYVVEPLGDVHITLSNPSDIFKKTEELITCVHNNMAKIERNLIQAIDEEREYREKQIHGTE